MTKRDFILSILSSLIGTFLFELIRKLYPRFRQLSLRIIALRIPLAKTIHTNYQLLKSFSSRLSHAALEALAYICLRAYAGVFKNEYTFRATIQIIFTIALVGSIFVALRSPQPGRNLEPPKDEVITRVDTLPYIGEVQTWAKSASSIVVKVPTGEKGKFVYISIPKRFPQDNPSSLDYLVNTSGGECRAYIRSKADEEIATTDCSVLWYTYKSSLY